MAQSPFWKKCTHGLLGGSRDRCRIVGRLGQSRPDGHPRREHRVALRARLSLRGRRARELHLPPPAPSRRASGADVRAGAARRGVGGAGSIVVRRIVRRTGIGRTFHGSGSSSGSGSNSGSSGGSGSTTATVPVFIKLKRLGDVRGIQQAPVQVSIITGRVTNALSVPVTALLARPGGYAVETVDAGGERHLVPVDLGAFDDANGLVQVRGSALSAGQRVVVPAT